MNNNENKKLPYISYLFKALSMIIVLISVTFSWFVFTKETTIDGSITGQATSVITVTLSDEEKNYWDSKLELTAEGGFASTTEYSGNGEKLYIPIIRRNQIQGFYLPSHFLSSAEDEEHNEDLSDKELTDEEIYELYEPSYVEIVAYVKTDGPISLYLGQDSEVVPVNTSKNLDYIAGAVRVAILVDGFEPFIWAPNSTYHHRGNGSVATTGEPESQYSYVYSDSDKQFLTTEDIVVIENPEKLKYGTSEDKRFVWGDLNSFSDYQNMVEPIFTTDASLNQDIEIKMTIRIWVEGTDREAVKELIGGKFLAKFQFLAVENKGVISNE